MNDDPYKLSWTPWMEGDELGPDGFRKRKPNNSKEEEEEEEDG